LSEELTPQDAGLDFAVNLEGRDFVGHDALARRGREPRARVRIGLELAGRRVPRQDYPVLNTGTVVGHVCSGTYSPTLERPIAMAYVQPDAACVGTELAVEIRGESYPARVVELPFYRRGK
jgi:aminomethyltransferase